MLGREFWVLTALFVTLAAAGRAETVMAERTIRAQAIIMPDDVTLASVEMPGMAASLDEVIGLEARVSIFAGRPIRAADVGPPAIIERNQSVTLVYQAGALMIAAEGRSLARGGIGDTIRVMNIGSRSSVSGIVSADGSVRVLSGI